MSSEASEKFSRTFGACVLLLQLVLIIVYACVTTYPVHTGATASSDDTVLLHYGKFQDVHVMIFIGFGFLMTFLKRYGFSSVGFNFLISALTIQVAMVNNGFWHQLLYKNTEEAASATPSMDPHWHKIEIDILDIITGDFAAGAVMITFGAVLDKTSPLELLFVMLVEMVFYAINESIGVMRIQAVDMGGSMFVHTFGAYFGLALSWMITPKEKFEEKEEGSVYHSDMFAMIGTIFLWMFWPSFNGALAAGDQQHRVIINTVIALTGSCVAAFVMSAFMRHDKKFDMVDIQNATLAGGVAVGSASDLVIEPWAAILIGLIAGTLSVIGYTVIQPWLQNNKIVHDTCGVHNLHGMPGILGGVCGAISAAVAGDSAYGEDISTIWAARSNATDNRSAGEQCGYQLAALFCSMAFAIVGGVVAGFVVNMIRSCMDPGPQHYFHDGDYWEGVCDLEGAPASMGFDSEGKAAEGENTDAPVGAATIHMDVQSDAFTQLQDQVRAMQAKMDSAEKARSGCATDANASEP